jgi:hypothetical protein
MVEPYIGEVYIHDLVNELTLSSYHLFNKDIDKKILKEKLEKLIKEYFYQYHLKVGIRED